MSLPLRWHEGEISSPQENVMIVAIWVVIVVVSVLVGNRIARYLGV